MKPYVKEFLNGVLLNPITKEKPYLHGKALEDYPLKKISVWGTVRNKFFKGKSIVKI